MPINVWEQIVETRWRLIIGLSRRLKCIAWKSWECCTLCILDFIRNLIKACLVGSIEITSYPRESLLQYFSEKWSAECQRMEPTSKKKMPQRMHTSLRQHKWSPLKTQRAINSKGEKGIGHHLQKEGKQFLWNQMFQCWNWRSLLVVFKVKGPSIGQKGQWSQGIHGWPIGARVWFSIGLFNDRRYSYSWLETWYSPMKAMPW